MSVSDLSQNADRRKFGIWIYSGHQDWKPQIHVGHAVNNLGSLYSALSRLIQPLTTIHPTLRSTTHATRHGHWITTAEVWGGDHTQLTLQFFGLAFGALGFFTTTHQDLKFGLATLATILINRHIRIPKKSSRKNPSAHSGAADCLRMAKPFCGCTEPRSSTSWPSPRILEPMGLFRQSTNTLAQKPLIHPTHVNFAKIGTKKSGPPS